MVGSIYYSLDRFLRFLSRFDSADDLKNRFIGRLREGNTSLCVISLLYGLLMLLDISYCL